MGKAKFRNQFDNVKERIEPKRNSVVSRLGFVSLSDRITSMLKHGKLIVQDLKDAEAMYDEQEGSWTDKEPSYDPTNDISIDKMDAMQMVNDFEDSLKESNKNMKAESLALERKRGTAVAQTQVSNNDNSKKEGAGGE